jgi:DNA polymerase-3 subunit epsilon
MSLLVVCGLLVILILIFVIGKTQSVSPQQPELGINPEPHRSTLNKPHIEFPDKDEAPINHVENDVAKKVLAPERRAELEQKRHELFGQRREPEPDVRISKPNRELPELLPSQFIIVDLETTGLSPRMDEIIEIGAIKVTLGAVEHPAFQVLVRPSIKVPRKIVEITGITQSMLDAEGIAPCDALTQFVDFAGALPFVTYNAAFDIGFLINTYQRHGRTFENKYDCALNRTRRAIPGLPNYKLAYISTLLKLPQSNQHRALADCERTVHVYLTSTLMLNQKVRWSMPST